MSEVGDETAALSDDAVVFEQLEALSGMGIPIALDDFGTGYSSLSHLTGLPISILKIDGLFVGRLGTSARHAGDGLPVRPGLPARPAGTTRGLVPERAAALGGAL